jgi:hypothetical protein
MQFGLPDAAGELRGVQIGGLNVAKQLHGIRIAVADICSAGFRGVQLGPVNVGPDGWTPVLGAQC